MALDVHRATLFSSTRYNTFDVGFHWMPVNENHNGSSGRMTKGCKKKLLNNTKIVYTSFA
jgi:hypothetical protein